MDTGQTESMVNGRRSILIACSSSRDRKTTVCVFSMMSGVLSNVCTTLGLLLAAGIIVSLIGIDSGEGAEIEIDSGKDAEIEFGANTSERAHNDKCSDPRFADNLESAESGMAERVYVADIFSDATDCYKAHEKGLIHLEKNVDGIDFGNDSDEYGRNYKCQDSRFVTFIDVRSSTESELELDAPEKEDASDCRLAYLTEEVWMPEEIWILDAKYDIVFGNDRGSWPRDDECDDPRFQNAPDSTSQVMAESLSANNVGNDATDCRKYFSERKILLRPIDDKDGIEFGDDTGRWAFDGECDDPRFENKPGMGNGMSSFFSKMGVKRDATDCRDAYDRGAIGLTKVRSLHNIEFGENTSIWAYDGECDDPRFRDISAPSESRTVSPRRASLFRDISEFSESGTVSSRQASFSDRGKDATDCFRAYQAEEIELTHDR